MSEEKIKGEFGLVYIEDGVVYPAYIDDKETLNFLAKGGMFGDRIKVTKDTPIGKVREAE